MNPRIGWGQPPAGWSSPHLPGWGPLVDPGPRPIQASRSLSRWLWPTLTVSSFLAVVAYTFARDDSAPGLSHRGLLTIALAALVVILLTIHRRYGPGSLVRAVAEYTVVALLAVLLAAGGGTGPQPTDRATPAKAGQAKTDQAKATPATKSKPEATSGDDRSAVLRVGAKVVRAVTGAVGWLVDLWRRADQQVQPTTGEAMASSPLSSPPILISLWRQP